MKTICESLHTKKDQLLSKIGELELQKATLEESERKSQVQTAELKEQVTSSVAALEKKPGNNKLTFSLSRSMF